MVRTIKCGISNISKQTIVKANDAMIHSKRTKAIRELAKKLAEKKQAEIITIPTNTEKTLFGETNPLVPTAKINMNKIWESVKSFLDKKHIKQ